MAKYIGITLYNDYPGNRREKGDIIPVIKQLLKIPLMQGGFEEKPTNNVTAKADAETKLKQDQLPTYLEKLELNTLLNKYDKYKKMGPNEVKKLSIKEKRERREILQAGEPTLQSLRNNKQ